MSQYVVDSVALVKRKDGEVLGVEFRRGDYLWFFSVDQDFWTGVRIGKFPCDADGSEFERQVVEFSEWSGKSSRERFGGIYPELEVYWP